VKTFQKPKAGLKKDNLAEKKKKLQHFTPHNNQYRKTKFQFWGTTTEGMWEGQQCNAHANHKLNPEKQTGEPCPPRAGTWQKGNIHKRQRTKCDDMTKRGGGLTSGKNLFLFYEVVEPYVKEVGVRWVGGTSEKGVEGRTRG